MEFSNRKMKSVIFMVIVVLAANGRINAAQDAAANTAIPEKQLVKMAPYLGYLEAHRELQKPMELLGGPITVSVKQEEGGVHVALPDFRNLDPRVFGIPELPRAYAGTPVMTGVPPSMRQEENGHYTQLNIRTPFGHNNVVLPNGRYSLEAVDATATDAAVTNDHVKMEASWQDKDGNMYGVRCSKVAPHGVEYPSFGGVLTNHILHGSSRIGTPLMPTEFVYVAFWGEGDVLKNGQVIDSGRIVHCMLTEFVRTAGYKLAFDDQITPTKLQMHLIVPPMVVANGQFEKSPVKTGFMLENGEEMPFWHVMFANLEIDSGRLASSSAAHSAADPPSGRIYVVNMTDDMKFVPERLVIHVGDTIEWQNTSYLVHSVSDDPAKADKKSDVELPEGVTPFTSGDIRPGQSYQHVFDKPGTYKYFCTFHEPEGMVGEVVVK